MGINYVPPRVAAKALGYHPQYLRKLADDGKIPYIRTPGGQRRYQIEEFVETQMASPTVPDVKVVPRPKSNADRIPQDVTDVSAFISALKDAGVATEVIDQAKRQASS